MKMSIYIIAILLLFSCNEDKGNYDYENINTLSVSLDELYSFRLEKDTTVTITPRLTQSLQEDKNNLRYVWLHSTTNHNFYGHGSFDTVGIEENLRFHIDPEDKKLKYDHYFRLNVYDSLTGIEYPVNTTVKLVKPYDGCWMLLYEKQGLTGLGSIEYMGNSILRTEDAYRKETGKYLQGRPLCLGTVMASCKYYGAGATWNMFSIITDDPREAGVYCQWKKFQKMDSLSRMVAPTVRGSFDYSDVKVIDGEATWGGLVLAGGVFYQTPGAMKIFKAPISADLSGDMNIKFATKVGFSSMLYDEAGHRFCFYHNTNRASTYDHKDFSESTNNPASYRIMPVPFRDNNVTAVDANALPQGQKVYYLGAGYQFDPTYQRASYAYALAVEGTDSCFVYEFNMDGMVSTGDGYPAFSGYYRLKMPKGLNENSCFASTKSFSGILFYGAGNTIYRLDFKQSGGKATPVYTHTGGNAVKMKFAKKTEINSNLDFTAYEFDPNRSLGITFDMGGGLYDFVVLNLSEMGSVGSDSESYPAKQVYTGFGEIKDFIFL